MDYLPVAQGPDVGEGSVERPATLLASALEAAQDDHALSGVQELLRYGLEIVQTLHRWTEDVVDDCFWAMVRASARHPLHIGFLPLDIRVHNARHGIDVAPVEGIVSVAQDVHVLFRHIEVSFRLCCCLYQDPTPRKGRLKRCGRSVRATEANFRELCTGEVPRIHLLGTWVNRPSPEMRQASSAGNIRGATARPKGRGSSGRRR